VRLILITNDDGISAGGMRLEVEGVPDKRAEEGTDLWAVTHGYVSVGIAQNIS